MRLHFLPETAFARDLRAKADAYFAECGISRRAPPAQWLKGALYFSIAVAAYTLILISNWPGPALLALAVVTAVAVILLAINLGHDGAHHTLSRARWLNDLVLTLSFAFVGVDPNLWRLRHARSHHIFPNVNGCDIDIDSNLFLRLSPNHPRRWYQTWQHLYAPFLFWIVGLHSIFVQDFDYLFKRDLANLRGIRHSPRVFIMFAVVKAIYLTLNYVLPIALVQQPWPWVIGGALLAQFVSSSLFVYLLIGTHFSEYAAFPIPDERGSLGNDFAGHAVSTSVDWHPTSRIAAFISGGTNSHAAHHLFPHIAHGHYVELSRIVAETAISHGVRYNATSLKDMVISHFRFLRRMGASSST